MHPPRRSSNTLDVKGRSSRLVEDPAGGSSNTSIYGGKVQTAGGHRTARPSGGPKLEPNKGTDGRYFDRLLRVRGWDSKYPSVQKLLDHLSRRTKSESSRLQYLNTLSVLCRRESKTPEHLVRISRREVEDSVQSYLDEMAKKGCSRKWVNVVQSYNLLAKCLGTPFPSHEGSTN